MEMQVCTRQKTLSIVRHGIGHHRYALVYIFIESDFVMIIRRIFVTKITVPNITSDR